MKRIVSAALVVVFLCLKISAQVPNPQIQLTGNIGAGGVFPLFNAGPLIFSSDASRTMAYPEMSAFVIKVVSSVTLTAARNLIAPNGYFTFAIENATTGGQSIQLIGATGVGVTIPNCSVSPTTCTAFVFGDGTNYYSVGSSAGGSMVYPGAGIGNSTGSAWGASYSSTNTIPANFISPLPYMSYFGSFTVGHCLEVESISPIAAQDAGSACGTSSGGLSSFSAPPGSWPSWLAPVVTNSTTTPSLAVTASPIPNAALANPGGTINGVSFALGSSINTPLTCGGSGGTCPEQQINPTSGAATVMTAAVTATATIIPVASCTGFTFVPGNIVIIEYNSSPEWAIGLSCTGGNLAITTRGFYTATPGTGYAWASGATVIQVTQASSTSSTAFPYSYTLANGASGYGGCGNIVANTACFGSPTTFSAEIQVGGSTPDGGLITSVQGSGVAASLWEPNFIARNENIAATTCGFADYALTTNSSSPSWDLISTGSLCTTGADGIGPNVAGLFYNHTFTGVSWDPAGNQYIAGNIILPATLTGYQGSSSGTKIPLSIPWATPSAITAICHDASGNITDAPGGGTCPGGGGTPGVDTRPNVVQATGKNGYLNPESSYQIFSQTGAGTITEIHITWGAVGGDTPNMVQNSQVNIACDGNLVSLPFGMLFVAEDAPVQFNTDYVGIPIMGYAFTGLTQGEMVFNLRKWINFYSSCTITLVNASSSAQSNIFVDTTYRNGTPVTPLGAPTSRAYWNAYPNYLSAVVPNTGSFNTPQVYLMPTSTLGPGEVESIDYFVNSPSGNGYLESGPITWTDSNIATQSGGGEDWAMCGYYCDYQQTEITTSRAGFLAGPFLQNKQGDYDTLMWRNFNTNPDDNVIFTSTLGVSSANGDAAYSTSPSIGMRSLVSFWTVTPIASNVQFSPVGGTYTTGQTVTLTAYPSGAVICYTTDGTTPTATTAGTCTHGTTYSASIALSAGATTINAISTKSGFTNGFMATNAYYASSSQSFSFVGSNAVQCGPSVATCAIASFTPTAGHVLVICGYQTRTFSTAPGPTLRLSGIGTNAATPLISNPATFSASSSGNNAYSSCWVVSSAVASAITPTITATTSASYVGVFYIEASSTNPIGGIDAQTAGNSTTTTCPIGPITTNNNDELMVAFVDTVTGSTGSTIAGGSPNAWVQSNTIGSYPAMFYQLNANKVTTTGYSVTASTCVSQIVTLY